MIFEGLLLYLGTLWASDRASITYEHTNVLGWNSSLNTLDITIYIPTNKSEHSLYKHT